MKTKSHWINTEKFLPDVGEQIVFETMGGSRFGGFFGRAVYSNDVMFRAHGDNGSEIGVAAQFVKKWVPVDSLC